MGNAQQIEFSRRNSSHGYSLDIEDGVGRVHSSLVLGGITDETLLVGERDEGGGGVATLVVGD